MAYGLTYSALTSKTFIGACDFYANSPLGFGNPALRAMAGDVGAGAEILRSGNSAYSDEMPVETFSAVGTGVMMAVNGAAAIANPTAALGVTAMQSCTAREMMGEDSSSEEDAVGAAADGTERAARRFTSTLSKAGDAAHTLGRVGKFLGPIGLATDLIGGAAKIGEAWSDPTLTDTQRDDKVGDAVIGTAGSMAGGAAGAWAGVAAGAAIGSAIPFVGTLVGGIIGGILGAFGGSKAGEATAEAVGNATGADHLVGGVVNTAFGV